MVLAIQAAEVASRACQGEAFGSRVEMVQRFLLHRVDGKGAGTGIDLADKRPLLVVPAAASARLADGYMAVMGAELTFHTAVIQPLVIFAFMYFHQKTIAS
jgi:hypothetical protein